MSAGYAEDEDEERRYEGPEQEPEAGPALDDGDQALALTDDEGPALALDDESPTGGALALDEPADGLDAISGLPGGAQDPAASPPGGELTPEQLAGAATVPRPVGPLDAVDQTLVDNPLPPGARAAAPAKPASIQQREEQAIAEGERLGEEAVLAEKKAGAARAKVAEAAAQQAAEQQRIQAEAAAQQKVIIDAAAKRTQQWMDRAAAENDKYMKMGLHDYWEGRPVGNKILAGMAMALGAAGGGSNPGMQIINNAIERDFRQQQAGIMKQKENVHLAREQVNDSLTLKQSELADNNLKKAAAYDAVAAQAVALKMKQGATLEEATTDKNVIALRTKANQTRNETLKVIHSQNLADSRLGIEREHLKIQQQDANTRRMMAEARAKKLKGGGGGGGGAANAGMAELIKMKEDGRPMSEIAIKAHGLRIPAGGKGGYLQMLKETRQSEKSDFAISERMAGLEATDEKGNVLGVWKNPQEARKGNEQNRAFEQAASRLKFLIDDIQKTGTRVLSAQDMQDRLSKGQAVAAAMRVYNGLGATDASQKLEADILGALGAPGHGWLMGANIKGIKHILHEAEQTHDARLKIGLRSAPSGGGGGGSGGHGASAPAKLTEQNAAKLIKFVKESPNDPRVDAAKKKLRESGYQVP